MSFVMSSMINDGQKLISTFFDLVKIDSPSGEEGKVRDYIIKRLSSLGMKAEVDGKGNVYSILNGYGTPILLSAHMDTVEPGRGVNPKLKDGVIESGGTTILGADNKAAITAILESLDRIKKLGRSVEVIFSVREETDGGINSFDFKKIKGKYGLVADRAASIGDIVLASPWILELQIQIKGKAAHSAVPEKGINALEVAFRSMNKIVVGRVDRQTTANIGLVKGGYATNTIPEDFRLEGEVRSFDKDSLDKYISNLELVFQREAKRAKANIKIYRQIYCSGYQLDRKDKDVKRLYDIFMSLKITPKYSISFGGSDANFFVKHGIKVINIGDGVQNAHTTSESVSIADLQRLENVFVEFVKRNV